MSRLWSRLVTFVIKAIAFANIDDLGEVRIHLLLNNYVTEDESSVIGSEREVFLVCAELAAGEDLTAFAVDRYFESVLH